MRKVIFWDFQGTLAHNDWMFSKAMYKAIQHYESDSKICIDDIKKSPLSGFPWQEPERDYSHIACSDTWWEHVQPIFIDAFRNLNFSDEKAILYTGKVRYEVAKSEEYSLYDDTLEVLDFFKKNGFSNIILSNHIPELPQIVEALGLSVYLEDCISSANVGYEKPNRRIYEYALEKTMKPDIVWMVGDSLVADVKGAENAGIKGVLVRSKCQEAIKYYSKDLIGLKGIIR